MPDLLTIFDAVDEPVRMLCIDSAFLACCLYKNNEKKAAIKLMSTCFYAAGLYDPVLINAIFRDIDTSMNTLKVHSELRHLNPEKK